MLTPSSLHLPDLILCLWRSMRSSIMVIRSSSNSSPYFLRAYSRKSGNSSSLKFDGAPESWVTDSLHRLCLSISHMALLKSSSVAPFHNAFRNPRRMLPVSPKYSLHPGYQHLRAKWFSNVKLGLGFEQRFSPYLVTGGLAK